jgi:hypothetical protein
MALALLALGGCASMSKEECRSADWREVGYHDGVKGLARSRAEDHAQACAEASVAVDRKAYFEARERGIRQYCYPPNGMNVGRAGQGYNDVCPPDLEPAFLYQYQLGRAVYDAEQRVSRLDSDQHDLEERLRKADKDSDRAKLRDKLRDLDHDLRRARDELGWRQSEALRGGQP